MNTPLFLEVETDAGVEAVDAQITLIGKELADHRLICKVEDLVLSRVEVELPAEVKPKVVIAFTGNPVIAKAELHVVDRHSNMIEAAELSCLACSLLVIDAVVGIHQVSCIVREEGEAAAESPLDINSSTDPKAESSVFLEGARVWISEAHFLFDPS